MKQTAVEFLADSLHGFIHPKHGKDFLPILEQAKAMEKEQIKEVFIDVSDVLLKETDTQQKAKIKQAAEQYYNETFKSE